MFDDLATPINERLRTALDLLLTAPLAKLLRNRRYFQIRIIKPLFIYIFEYKALGSVGSTK